MSAILNYGRERPELVELGVLDESADYETDITEIHYDPIKKEFILLTASGCSCWSGEYDEARFSNSKELCRSLMTDTSRSYNPSFEGARRLIREARENYKAYKAASKFLGGA